MAKSRRPLTDAERDERRAQQRQLMTDAVEALRGSDGWQRYLTTRRAFRSYSPRNILLIGLQHPTATQVAGFRKWLDLGYAVRRGETAIRIWSPCPPTRKQLAAWRAAGADPQEKPRTFFRLAAVFAQDQVAELPPPATPAPLSAPTVAPITGDSHAGLLCDLRTLAHEIGYTFEISDTTVDIPGHGQVDGYCSKQRRCVVVDGTLAPNGQLATGIHELAHALVNEDELAPQLSYAEGELIAESVAWCCCQTVGLTTDANSIPYLAGWAQEASLEVLQRAAELCDRLARRIEAAVIHDTPDPDADPAPTAAAADVDVPTRDVALAA